MATWLAPSRAAVEGEAVTPLPHRIHGTDYALCVKHGKRVKVGEACPVCPSSKPAPPDHPGLAKVAKPSGKHRCVLGHNHDSGGEASACSPIHTAAAHAGLTVFRPGRPGIPCFRVAPDELGRPCYVAPDWVLCDAAGKPVLMLDWKPETSGRSMRRSESWPRGKRIVEAELNAKCVEIRSLDEIGAAVAALNQSARAEGG